MPRRTFRFEQAKQAREERDGRFPSVLVPGLADCPTMACDEGPATGSIRESHAFRVARKKEGAARGRRTSCGGSTNPAGRCGEVRAAMAETGWACGVVKT